MLNLIQDGEKKGDLNPIPTQSGGGGAAGGQRLVREHKMAALDTEA